MTLVLALRGRDRWTLWVPAQLGYSETLSQTLKSEGLPYGCGGRHSPWSLRRRPGKPSGMASVPCFGFSDCMASAIARACSAFLGREQCCRSHCLPGSRVNRDQLPSTTVSADRVSHRSPRLESVHLLRSGQCSEPLSTLHSSAALFGSISDLCRSGLLHTDSAIFFSFCFLLFLLLFCNLQLYSSGLVECEAHNPCKIARNVDVKSVLERIWRGSTMVSWHGFSIINDESWGLHSKDSVFGVGGQMVLS